jgi:hypothetical protein
MGAIIMAKAKIEMLISILKYIDIDYMSEEECNSIYFLDVNNTEQQKQIIRTIIVPGFKELNNTSQERLKEVLKLCLQDMESVNVIFERVSMPFENDIEDKKAFLENIYEELFGKL